MCDVITELAIIRPRKLNLSFTKVSSNWVTAR